MKKIGTLMFLVFSGLYAAAQGGGVSGAVGKHSKNCDGLGLCKVETTKPGLTQMNFKLDAINGILTFSFNEDALMQNQPDKLDMLRGKSVFVQEEEFELPADLSRQLGSPYPIVIHQGNHQMQYKEGTYTVIVRVDM